MYNFKVWKIMLLTMKKIEIIYFNPFRPICVVVLHKTKECSLFTGKMENLAKFY